MRCFVPGADLTMFVPPCDRHPSFNTWPDRNLIDGRCPACGTGNIDGCWRELKARRLVRERALLDLKYGEVSDGA